MNSSAIERKSGSALTAERCRPIRADDIKLFPADLDIADIMVDRINVLTSAIPSIVNDDIATAKCDVVIHFRFPFCLLKTFNPYLSYVQLNIPMRHAATSNAA